MAKIKNGFRFACPDLILHFDDAPGLETTVNFVLNPNFFLPGTKLSLSENGGSSQGM